MGPLGRCNYVLFVEKGEVIYWAVSVALVTIFAKEMKVRGGVLPYYITQMLIWWLTFCDDGYVKKMAYQFYYYIVVDCLDLIQSAFFPIRKVMVENFKFHVMVSCIVLTMTNHSDCGRLALFVRLYLIRQRLSRLASSRKTSKRGPSHHIHYYNI